MVRWNLLYSAYERRLTQRLDRASLPRHVGVIVDGNRRFARAAGAEVDAGYQAGADKIVEFLDWCDDLGIELVTLWLLSTDNLQRPAEELAALLDVIEDLVDILAEDPRWHVRIVGSLELLPDADAERLRLAAARTEGREGLVVNVCVGYGGRQELTDAMRSLLLDQAASGHSIEEIASSLDVDAIAGHLYTKGQPDPDLLIRTSGEQRLSGFLLWQSVHSEFYFCDALWPAFRRVDFLRALRSFAERERRFGH